MMNDFFQDGITLMLTVVVKLMVVQRAVPFNIG